MQFIGLPELRRRSDDLYMNGINKMQISYFVGERIVLTGESGSGKTRILDCIYRNEGERWKGNVIFVPSPSRRGDNLLRFSLNSGVRVGVREMAELGEYLERKGEGSSGSENIEVLYSLFESGALREDSLLIFDSLDAFMDIDALCFLFSFLKRVGEEMNITLIASISSAMAIRASEIYLLPEKYYWCDRKTEEAEEVRADEIYSRLLSSLEAL